MHINYFADDQGMPVGAEFNHAFELALEMNRNLLTRGAAILTLGIGVRPVLANSESLAGKALAESTIFRHTGSITTLKQNSRVSRTFLSVCFSVPVDHSSAKGS
jgi:hypothetical protein